MSFDACQGCGLGDEGDSLTVDGLCVECDLGEFVDGDLKPVVQHLTDALAAVAVAGRRVRDPERMPN